MFYIIAVLYCLPAPLLLAGEAKTQNTCNGCLTTLNLKSQQMAKMTAKTTLKASDYNYKKTSVPNTNFLTQRQNI